MGWLSGIFDSIGDFFSDLWDAISEAYQDAWDWLGDSLQSLWAHIRPILAIVIIICVVQVLFEFPLALGALNAVFPGMVTVGVWGTMTLAPGAGWLFGLLGSGLALWVDADAVVDVASTIADGVGRIANVVLDTALDVLTDSTLGKWLLYGLVAFIGYKVAFGASSGDGVTVRMEAQNAT